MKRFPAATGHTADNTRQTVAEFHFLKNNAYPTIAVGS
jgi:hypothetical protein